MDSVLGFTRRRFSWYSLVVVLLVLTLRQTMPAFAQSAPDGVEPEAGRWETWVLESGDELRLPAPPDEATTADEIAQLLELAAQRDDEAMTQIAYWNSGPPAYRWNQIAMDELLDRAVSGPASLRHLALLNVAIYDATVAAWDSKYAYNRPRPSEVEPAIQPAIANPPSPSYPSEYAVTAGAASTVLSWLFPDRAAYFEARAQEAVYSRLLAGVEYLSDVEAGLALGRQVAERVIERGNADHFTDQWTGSVPTEPGLWTGQNPALPLAGTWQPWALTSPDQFRPAPPPAFNSDQLAAEMEELRAFERTPVTNAIAEFWEHGAGGRRIHWFWNDVATRLILSSAWDDNAPRAAQAYALTNIAGYDATVACWDAKYTYWGIRPFQYDPTFSTVFVTPNHPSYPSAHSCISAAMADVLAALFPADAEEVQYLASEATESRIWAGIHFRSDTEAGSKLGHDVAGVVLERGLAGSM